MISLFEYIQSCTIEDMAEIFYEYQKQCEENIFTQLKEADIDFTMIEIDKDISISGIMKFLSNRKISDWE